MSSKNHLASSKLSSFSEYNIIDLDEDETTDEDDDADAVFSIHSDLGRIREDIPGNGVPSEEYSFDSSSALGVEDLYTFDPGGKVMGLILENEKQNEVSCAPIHV